MNNFHLKMKCAVGGQWVCSGWAVGGQWIFRYIFNFGDILLVSFRIEVGLVASSLWLMTEMFIELTKYNFNATLTR